MPGIEPGAFHMRSERSTTELHPLTWSFWITSSILDRKNYWHGGNNMITCISFKIIVCFHFDWSNFSRVLIGLYYPRTPQGSQSLIRVISLGFWLDFITTIYTIFLPTSWWWSTWECDLLVVHHQPHHNQVNLSHTVTIQSGLLSLACGTS